MRKNLKLGLVLACITGFMLFSNVFADGVKINVNGKEINSDVECYIKDNRTMVPIRFIAEELGAEIRYNEPKGPAPASFYVRAPYDQLGLSMYFGYPVGVISEGTFRSDVAPEIKNNRSMVPLRYIADYLNLDVKWEDETNTVYLTNSDKDPYKNFNEKYYDDVAAEKYSNWLTNPNRTFEQYIEAHK